MMDNHRTLIQVFKTLSDYVERTTHWREGGVDRHDAKLALKAAGEVIGNVEWTEKGLTEWRALTLANLKQARAAQARADIATTHLQAVLNKAWTFAEQQAADTAARNWLVSIGSEPT